MKSYASYLVEAKQANEEKLTHLEHAEDHVLNAGEEGFHHAYNNLLDVHNHLTRNPNDTKITTKFDGSPSVVFGTNPNNNKFFVASKSAFNKAPKINYSHEDIEQNHGHSPGLVEKLKAAFDHLPKVTPRKGVYQADIMHTPSDVKYEGGKVKFKPNTIEYSTTPGSHDGRSALNSKVGVAIHTAYRGPTLETMKAEYAPDIREFSAHPDVHVIPTHTDLSKANYTTKQQKQFMNHLNKASNAFSNMKRKDFTAAARHSEDLKTYINKTVRENTKPNHDDFISYLENQKEKAIDAAKSSQGKITKRYMHDEKISHAIANKESIDKMLELHKHLQNAKDVLVNSLSSIPSKFDHSIGGKPSKPEGFVVVRNNRPTKFVDRNDFSRSNFLKER